MDYNDYLREIMSEFGLLASSDNATLNTLPQEYEQSLLRKSHTIER